MSNSARQKLSGTVLALDVDGVLLDPDRAGKGPWQHSLRQTYGVDPTLLDGAFFARSWSDVIVGREAIEPALERALVELGWEVDVEELLRCWFESDFELDHQVVDAAAGWIESGITVVLVSNQEVRRARYLEQHLAASLRIDGFASSGALGVVKSDVAFYPAAEDLLGIDAGTRVVFVDDTLANVAAAKQHGWHGIHFVKTGRWQSEVDAALAG